MPCQICGKESGYFPICKEHQRMAHDGKVAKCKDCGSWYLVASGCSNGCENEPIEERDTSMSETDSKSETHDSYVPESKSGMEHKVEISEDGKFGRILSFKMLSYIMQKDPIPDRHNTLQFDLAAELLLSSNDGDVRVDIKPIRSGPRAHIWYFAKNYSAPIMFRIVRGNMSDANKKRAWKTYLQDLSKLEKLITNDGANEAYCLLFTNDDEYKRKVIESDMQGNLVDISGISSQSRYYCFVCHVNQSRIAAGMKMSFRGGSQHIDQLDASSDESLQQCVECGKVIPTNPMKPRCYQCWCIEFSPKR